MGLLHLKKKARKILLDVLDRVPSPDFFSPTNYTVLPFPYVSFLSHGAFALGLSHLTSFSEGGKKEWTREGKAVGP